MTSSFRSVLERFRFGVVAALFLLFLMALLLLAPPDGVERGSLMQLVGRFHPLCVHFPIAVLLIVPLFEILGRKRTAPFLLASVDFLLLLAACGAILSALLGWCLARGGGYSGPLVRQHMWGGLLVAAASSICYWLRSRQDSPATARLYGALLLAAIILVSFTGYRGGQLAHGETHLTEFLPSRLRTLLGPSSSETSIISVKDPSAFYDVRIQPLFAGHCVTCHGQSKHKAGLRLDSYALVMHGGKHGPVIKPGDLKGSELFRRVTLPQSDDDFMPADNKRPLSASEVKLIQTWIAEGASRSLRAEVLAALPGNASTETTVAEVTFPATDPAAVARERAAVASILSRVQLRLPNIVEYESRTSADLVVNASWRGAKFGDDELAELAALSPSIVAADFTGTAITDRSARVIAAMKKLRHLRMAHTAITDRTIESLGSLDELESLSVFDTQVTESSLSMFIRLAKLRKVYAGGTKIPQGIAMSSPVREKLVF
jgi:uncharacterized membrane protein